MVVDAFGSHTKQFFSKPSQHHEKVSSQFSFRCQVQLYCIKQYKSIHPKHKSSISYLYGLSLINPSLIDNRGSNIQQQTMIEFFSPFTAFIMDKEGKIYQVFHEKQHNPWASMIKKSIIDQLQTKIHGKQERLENSIDGKRRVKYNRTVDSKGEILVHKSSNTNDIEKLNEKISKESLPRDEIKSKINQRQLFDPNGNMLQSVKHNNFDFGTPSPHSADAATFARIKKAVGKETSEETELPLKDLLQVNSYASLKRIQDSKHSHQHKLGKEFLRLKHFALKQWSQAGGANTLSSPSSPYIFAGPLEEEEDEQGNTLIYSRRPYFHMHPNITRSTLLMSAKEVAYGLAQDAHFLHKQIVHLEHVLEQIDKQRDNSQEISILIAKAAEYVKAFPKQSISILMQQMNDILHQYPWKRMHQEEEEEEYARQIIRLKICQALMSQIDTKEAQLQFIEMMNRIFVVANNFTVLDTTTSRSLTIHGLLKSMEFSKPCRSFVHQVKHWFTTILLHFKMDDMLYETSYLAFCSLANRIKFVTPIISQLYETILKEPTLTTDNVMLHVIALRQAGRGIPVFLLEKLLLNPNIDIKVRMVLLEGLVHRKEKSHAKHLRISHTIHKIVKHHLLEDEIKTIAIRTQQQREELFPHWKKGYHLIHFGKRWLQQQDSPMIREELHQYLSRLRGKNARNLMKWKGHHSDFEWELDPNDDEYANSLFFKKAFRKLKNTVRNVGRGIGKTARNVGRGIGKAATNVGRGIGKAAKHTGRALNKFSKTKLGKVVGMVVTAPFSVPMVVGKLVVDKIGDAAKAVKRAFDKLKEQFSAARIDQGRKICYPTAKQGDQICLFDRDMNAFISRHAEAMRNNAFGKGFDFEKMVGVKILYLYVGAMGGISSDLNCKTNQMSILLFGRANIHGQLFGKRLDILTAYLDFGMKTGSQASNEVYFNALGFTRKAKIVQSVGSLGKCAGHREQLYQHTFSNLAPLPKIPFFIGIGTLTIGITITAGVTVDAAGEACVPKFSASVEPGVTVGIGCRASLGIAYVAEVEVQASMNYKLVPSVGVENCKPNAKLSQSVSPFKLEVSATASLGPKTWKAKIV